MSGLQKPLKLAFIGGGRTSAVGYVHFSAAQLDNKFQVVAGAFCRNEKDNLLTGEYWGVELSRCYSSWKLLIDKERDNIDAVVILTPTPLHLEILIALLKNNIPIICEKSLVMDLPEIDELYKHYNPEKHFLAITFNYSGYAMLRELKERVNKGELGVIQKIRLEMPQEGFRRPPDIAGKTSQPQSWRLKDGSIPTICLDLGVHLHHLSSFILNKEPLSLIADFNNHSDYKELIDDIQILLKYPGNITGHMWMSKTAIGKRNGLKLAIYGDKGSASWYQLNPDELKISLNDGSNLIIDRASNCNISGKLRYNRMKPGHPSGFIEAFANLYSDIADALYTFKYDNQPLYSKYVYGVDSATDGIKLFKTAVESNKKRTWIEI